MYLRGSFGGLFASRFRKVVFLVVVLLFSLTVGVYAYLTLLPPKAGPKVTIISPPLEFSMELEKTEFQQGEHVNITVSLKNIGNETIQLMWTSYYSYDDIITDENNKIIYRWSQILYFDIIIMDENNSPIYQWSMTHFDYPAVLKRTLKPGEHLISVYPWYQTDDYPDAQVPKGTYYVKALTRKVILTVGGQTSTIQLETPTLTFIIK